MYFVSSRITIAIKPISYPPSSISALPPPKIEKNMRLVYDSYYGAGFQTRKCRSNSFDRC